MQLLSPGAFNKDLVYVKPRANGRNTVGQQLPTSSDATCRVRLHTRLRVATCCWELLPKV